MSPARDGSASRIARASCAAVVLIVGCRAYDRAQYAAALDGGADVVAADDQPGTDAPADTLADTPADVPTNLPPDVLTDALPRDAAADALTADITPAGDSGPDPTSCNDVHAGAVFCDGFENPTLAAWRDITQDNGTVVRTTAMSYRGAASLRTETTAVAGARAFIYVDALHARMSGEAYVRGYYYFPSGYAFTGLSVMALLEPATPYRSVDLQSGLNGRLASYSGPGMRLINGSVGAVIPRDRWVCLELHVTISATNGTVELFLNGDLAGSASGFSTLPMGGLGTLEVGQGFLASGQAPAVVYVDEVVVDNRRIGCD